MDPISCKRHLWTLLFCWINKILQHWVPISPTLLPLFTFIYFNWLYVCGSCQHFNFLFFFSYGSAVVLIGLVGMVPNEIVATPYATLYLKLYWLIVIFVPLFLHQPLLVVMSYIYFKSSDLKVEPIIFIRRDKILHSRLYILIFWFQNFNGQLFSTFKYCFLV